MLTKIGQRLVLLIFCLLPHHSFSSAQSVVIAEHSWTSKVVEMQPADRLPAVISPQPIYLWLRVEGDAEALRKLEERGMLPIRCRWIHYAGTRISQEGFGTLVDEIKLGVGTSALVHKLGLEIQNKPNHCFDWRTWSMKKRARYGDWEVEVVYSDPARTPMLCRSEDGGEPVPCRFEITVH